MPPNMQGTVFDPKTAQQALSLKKDTTAQKKALQKMLTNANKKVAEKQPRIFHIIIESICGLMWHNLGVNHSLDKQKC